jgi:hypothetical protein
MFKLHIDSARFAALRSSLLETNIEFESLISLQSWDLVLYAINVEVCSSIQKALMTFSLGMKAAADPALDNRDLIKLGYGHELKKIE